MNQLVRAEIQNGRRKSNIKHHYVHSVWCGLQPKSNFVSQKNEKPFPWGSKEAKKRVTIQTYIVIQNPFIRPILYFTFYIYLHFCAMRLYAHFFHASIAIHVRWLWWTGVAGILDAKTVSWSWFFQTRTQWRSRHWTVKCRTVRHTRHRCIHWYNTSMSIWTARIRFARRISHWNRCACAKKNQIEKFQWLNLIENELEIIKTRVEGYNKCEMMINYWHLLFQMRLQWVLTRSDRKMRNSWKCTQPRQRQHTVLLRMDSGDRKQIQNKKNSKKNSK